MSLLSVDIVNFYAPWLFSSATAEPPTKPKDRLDDISACRGEKVPIYSMSSQGFGPLSNGMYIERTAFAPHKNYQVAPPRSEIRKSQNDEQPAVVSALEKYDILSRVGEGSFGVVHQCRLKSEKQLAQPLGKFAHLAGRMLAIKKFRTEGQDDIALREIKMLKVSSSGL